MGIDLDDRLRALAVLPLGPPSPQLEAGVWRRIAAQAADTPLPVQIAAAAVTVGLALAIGLGVGAAGRSAPDDYARIGPLHRLESGL